MKALMKVADIPKMWKKVNESFDCQFDSDFLVIARFVSKLIGKKGEKLELASFCQDYNIDEKFIFPSEIE
jgi:hypothetical protein